MSKYAKISNKKIRETIYQKYDGKCAYCGDDLTGKFTIDHITPKRRKDPKHPNKGKDTIDNYNPCCYSCNSSKSTFTLEQWREEISLKVDRLMRDSSQFRLVWRFGLIGFKKETVTFYFEECE